jgi:lipopolysaccharide export system permease protein
MAILLTFLRMSNDNEIMALKSCGINPHHFLAPVLAFCLLGGGLTAYIAMVGMPWGNRSFNLQAIELAQAHVDTAIKERTFIDGFNGLTLYINHVDMQSKSLQDIFIQDSRTAGIHNTIIAPRGRLTIGSSEGTTDRNVLRLTLLDGILNQVNLEDRSAHTVEFQSYDMRLDLKELVSSASKRKRIDEMTMDELYSHIESNKQKKKESYYVALCRLHEKFALPFACFALGIMALPLGIQPRRDRRSFGIVIGTILFLVYYIMLSTGWSLGESGSVPPIIGMWAPNIIIGGIGIYLYIRCMRDNPLCWGSFLPLPNLMRRRQAGRIDGLS